MKKLILALVLFSTVIGFSQEERKKKRPDLTVEQKVELHSKKMKLDLDLSDTQMTEVKKLLTAQIKKREVIKNELKAKKEKGEKLSSDEKFAMKNKKLDEQIAMKAEMKKILKPEQYIKWEQIVAEKGDKFEDRKGKKSKLKPLEEDVAPIKE